MYGGEDYDLAGFCVGLVEKDAIIDGRQTRAGDAIIGLASSGAHSNGYSLIRKLLADTGSGPQTTVGGANLHELLLAPTRIYVRAVRALLRELPVHSIAHITGGGPSGNIPRTLPPGVEAMIDPRRWSRPMVFDWLQAAGRIEDAEMYRTFNCGLGMTLCVAPGDADRALAILAAHGETASVIGEVRRGDRGVVVTG
jgi:phosphoribosylformylglycinamidine cyclo-ligase